MLELLALYLGFALLSLTGALAPGPLMTLAISEGARAGRWAGVRLAVGHGLIEIPLVFAIAYGLGAFLQVPLVRGGIGLIGALVLLWMGYGLIAGVLRRRLSLTPAGASVGAPMGTLRFGHVVGGLIVTVANPYWSFWWATVGAGRTTEVASLALGPLAIAGLALVHWLTDLGWLGGLSFVTASGRDAIGDGVYRSVLLVCGAFLLAFGVYLGWGGAALLIGHWSWMLEA